MYMFQWDRFGAGRCHPVFCLIQIRWGPFDRRNDFIAFGYKMPANRSYVFQNNDKNNNEIKFQFYIISINHTHTNHNFTNSAKFNSIQKHSPSYCTVVKTLFLYWERFLHKVLQYCRSKRLLNHFDTERIKKSFFLSNMLFSTGFYQIVIVSPLYNLNYWAPHYLRPPPRCQSKK